MKYLLTCSAWLETIAKKEIINQWWNISLVKDRLIFFEGEIDLIAKINLHSRVWNKLYIVLAEKENLSTFDELYNLIFNISWKKYLQKDFPILTKATSIKSTLTSTPALQKITKKAIIDSYTNKSWERVFENSKLPEIEILTFLIENNAYMLLNTSGETLYKRWYKINSWEAPIKESLASWLIILSNWNFNDNFYDISCWSWTIPIEACLIAKNIPPWLNRNFAFEKRNFISSDLLFKYKQIAKTKIYNKKYNIFAFDIDENILEIAKQNAINAWLKEDDIIFTLKDLKEFKKESLNWNLISNPPYWIRLKQDDLDVIYKDISYILTKNMDLKWWIITSYNFDKNINLNKYKKRKLYNWNELCYFYYKK